MFIAPSNSRAVYPYLQTLLLRVSLSRFGGKHRHPGRRRGSEAEQGPRTRLLPATMGGAAGEPADSLPPAGSRAGVAAPPAPQGAVVPAHHASGGATSGGGGQSSESTARQARRAVSVFIAKSAQGYP